MKRTWTKIGADDVDGLATDCGPTTKARIARHIAALTWRELPCELAMMPGENIKALIRELRLPKVSHVAVSHELAPYGLYGIRCHYSNGTAQVYAVDHGSNVTVIASDFWKEEAA